MHCLMREDLVCRRGHRIHEHNVIVKLIKQNFARGHTYVFHKCNLLYMLLCSAQFHQILTVTSILKKKMIVL